MITWSKQRIVKRASFGVLLFTMIALVVGVTSAGAMTLVKPANGAQLEWYELNPAVSLDSASDEQLKWVLIGIDPEMKKTVRYCRQFGYTIIDSFMHTGCNAWAIGVDIYGIDSLRGLNAGTYYWQVVYLDKDGQQKTSEIRSFTIKAAPEIGDVGTISDQIFGSAVSDGTELNLGKAAFVNSGVKVHSIRSARIKRHTISIGVSFEGEIDASRSYIRIKSKAGTRYIPVTLKKTDGGTSVEGVWKQKKQETRLRPGKFTYQALLKSTKNDAFVKSEVRVILLKKGSSGKPGKPKTVPVKPF